MVTFKHSDVDVDIIHRRPTSYEVYKTFRGMMLTAKEEGVITTAQYKNALGQFKSGDYKSCYGFLANKNLYYIISSTTHYARTVYPYMVCKTKITFDKPVKMAKLEIDPPKEDK